MDKEYILSEIKRTAAANGEKPLGVARFEKETGLKRHEWYGVYWARWGDALAEAGFTPNLLQGAYDDDFLVEYMIEFIRKIGGYPTSGEIRIRARNNTDFPSHTVFSRVG